MVSSASDDLPDPDGPQNTVICSRGSRHDTFFRLCWLAPWTSRWVMYSAHWSATLCFGTSPRTAVRELCLGNRTGASAAPVCDPLDFATCSGVPVTTTSPPP